MKIAKAVKSKKKNCERRLLAMTDHEGWICACAKSLLCLYNGNLRHNWLKNKMLRMQNKNKNKSHLKENDSSHHHREGSYGWLSQLRTRTTTATTNKNKWSSITQRQRKTARRISRREQWQGISNSAVNKYQSIQYLFHF